MTSGRQFDAAEQHVRAQDRRRSAVDLGNPSRIIGVVQRQHAPALAVGLDLDAIGPPRHNAGGAGARIHRRVVAACWWRVGIDQYVVG